MAKRSKEELVAIILKNECCQKLKTKVDAKFDNLKNGYAEREIQTWPFQVKEAEIIIAGGTPDTNFIENAKQSNETVLEYAQKVMTNNLAWSNYGGKIVSWRSAMEGQIEAAETEQDYQAILEAINNA